MVYMAVSFQSLVLLKRIGPVVGGDPGDGVDCSVDVEKFIGRRFDALLLENDGSLVGGVNDFVEGVVRGAGRTS
jgi:hypothetical protein